MSTAISMFVFACLAPLQSVKAAADSTLYFNPASTSVVNGASFSLDAMINPGTNHVSAVTLHITYDQTKLALDSITPSTTFSLVLANASIDNANGTASIDVAVPATSSSITATSSTASFVFHAIAVGANSPVAFTTASQAAADGESGNVITTRTGATVTVTAVASDTAAPVISNAAPASGTALAAGTTETTVSVTTNENATCKYSQNSGTAYAAMTNTFSTTGTTSHSFAATGLANSASYAYFVRCQDAAGNANTGDAMISFSVAAPVVTTTPSVSSSNNNDDDDNDSKNHSSKKKKKTSPRKITNSKKTIKYGLILTQRGKKFSKNSLVKLYFSKPGGGYYAPQTIKTSSSGGFMLKYRVLKPKGRYGWYALDTKTGKKSRTIYYKVK